MEPLLWAVVFVFTVSFVSNVSPFIGASYTLLTSAQITLLGFTPFTFAILVLVSAVGATLAKVGIYYGAFEFKGQLKRNRNIRLIGRYSTREAFYVVLFVAALIPVFPLDDFIYIGAGATSASLGLMSAVTLLAKLIKSGVEIALELTILKGLSTLFSVPQLYLAIAFSVVFVAIGITIYKVDWEATYRRLRREKPSAPEQLAGDQSDKVL